MSAFYYDVESSLGFMTITANRLLGVFFRKQLARAGIAITGEQWGVLVLIWNRGSIAQDEMAHILCLDKSSLSRVLDVLERKGLVRRERDSSDARRRILHTTDKADAMRDTCRRAADAAMARALDGVSRKDHAVCLKVLERIKKTIREAAE